MLRTPSVLSRIAPAFFSLSARERVRATAGALLGVLITGVVARLLIGDDSPATLLIAPMGASAVLLFAVPSSPLAQPWSILGGNLVAAVVGVTAAIWIADPLLAASVAIGAAIAGMFALRCVHPPSGAVALTAVLGGPAITSLGYGFVLWPVLGNSVLLLAAALAYNNATGRRYPARPAAAAIEGTNPSARRVGFGFTSADIDAALAEYDQLLDMERGELERLLSQAEIHALRRRAGQITCADIMSRNVLAVAPETTLGEALDRLRQGHIKALPVTDENARIIGIVTQTDLLDKADWGARGPRLGVGRRVRLTLRHGKAPEAVVRDIMTAPVRSATPDAQIVDVVQLMTTAGLHDLPIVDRNDQLVGMVAHADLLAALLAGMTASAPEPDARAA